MANRQNYYRSNQSAYHRSSYRSSDYGRRDNRYSGSGNRNSYVEGNTARQLAAEPKRREQERPERQVRRAPHREPVNMPGVHWASIIFLLLALAGAIYICLSYVHSQNRVQEQKRTIVKMQSEIAQMRESNELAYQNVIDSVDLAEVYRMATEELGMVHAKSNQVYTYENKKSDMVKQYGEIPGVTK
ncbi:MAG: hypothetical protein J1E62_01870 [Lachnospiraceae bacterium]|nr:hypothetical protein [Lachnospiraceae bacterium]